MYDTIGKVRIAFDWLWLAARDLGIRMGSADGGMRTTEGRIAVIRAVEAQLDIALLPPDVT